MKLIQINNEDEECQNDINQISFDSSRTTRTTMAQKDPNRENMQIQDKVAKDIAILAPEKPKLNIKEIKDDVAGPVVNT